MNKKEILIGARQDVRKNFWIYLAVVIIFSIVSGIGDGVFNMFGNLNRFVAAIRSGMLTHQQLASPDSELWSVLLEKQGVLFSGVGIFGLLISLFVVNPLSVGINKVFLRGINGRPKIETITEPFREKYLNIVVTLFLSNLLLEIILFAVALLYTVVMGIMAGIIIVSDNLMPALMIAGIIISCILFIVCTICYIAWTVSISYNFLMIGYILTEHPEYSFSEAYNLNKKMVYHKKWEIFKIDFHYSVWMMLSIMIPVGFLIAGLIKMSLSAGGTLYIVLGILLIIPVVFINLFISLFRESAWAHIYSKLKVEESVENNENILSSYETPIYHEPISYVPDESCNDSEKSDETDETQE